MRKLRNSFQKKNKIEFLKILKEVGISNLPDKEFKIMPIKMVTKLERKHEYSEEVQKRRWKMSESTKMKVTGLKNSITELENVTKGTQLKTRSESRRRRKKQTYRQDKRNSFSKEQLKKKKTKSEDSLRDLWDTIQKDQYTR